MGGARVHNPVGLASRRSSYEIFLRPVGWSREAGSRPTNFSGVFDFITQLADDPSLVAWWGRMPRRTIIGIATF